MDLCLPWPGNGGMIPSDLRHAPVDIVLLVPLYFFWRNVEITGAIVEVSLLEIELARSDSVGGSFCMEFSCFWPIKFIDKGNYNYNR